MYQFDSRIRYSEINADGRLSLLALMDYFQDCSAFQSESIGYGISYLKENHRAWVLSSWHIYLEKMPGLADHVWIRTWPYEIKGFYGLRNFSMDDEEGRHYAWANSVWAYIDTETGRPCRVPEVVREAYGIDLPPFENDRSRKIQLPEKDTAAGSLIVPADFIDTNQHMNNSRYIMVAAEYLPPDFIIHELLVVYKKAALAGDRILVRTAGEKSSYTVNLTDPDGVTYAIVKFS